MPHSNFLLNADSYKASHWQLYVPGTENMFSYIESRGGIFPKTLFFGLQIYLKEYLCVPITQEMVDEAEVFVNKHIGTNVFNKEGWQYIVDKHNGLLPIRIRAVEEGIVIPNHNVLVTVEATDPNCAWLVSFIETSLLRSIWYPSTVATVSWHIKQIIKKYLNDTSNNIEAVGFGLLDFGARGCSSLESSKLGGCAHLINFIGSDNMEAIVAAHDFYDEDMAGFSVMATEHSVMCSYGQENELKSFKHILEVSRGKKIVSVVSDTWNIYEACKKWGSLSSTIKATDQTLVVRPDSGSVLEVLPQVFKTLEQGFGAITNNKGYKVLQNVKILWGDGIDYATINPILSLVQSLGFSTENIMLGSGGGLLQKVNRDTLKFAMKASAIKVDGEWQDVFKDPITDPGKKSKKGILELYRDKTTGQFLTLRVEEGDGNLHLERVMETVFENGKVLKKYTFEEVRANSEK